MITAAPSIDNCRKWFIFRENGQEISFVINDNFGLKAISHPINEDEMDHIKTEILPNLKVI